MSCKYCENETNDFIEINDTFRYSGIEMSMNRQGMLRVRVDLGPSELHKNVFETEDIVNIKFCPFCGKKLKRRYQRNVKSTICQTMEGAK